MSKHKSRKYRKDQPQTTWEIIKDLFLHPFEYRKKNTNNSIGKFLGGLCIFLALFKPQSGQLKQAGIKLIIAAVLL